MQSHQVSSSSSSSCRAPVGGSGSSARINCCSSLSFLAGFALVFLLFCWQSTFVDAKRGCANFGHSCYGGMGKRAEYIGQEMVGLQDEEDPVLFIQPRNDNPSLPTHRLFQPNVRADNIGAPTRDRIPFLPKQLIIFQWHYYGNQERRPVQPANYIYE